MENRERLITEVPLTRAEFIKAVEKFIGICKRLGVEVREVSEEEDPWYWYRSLRLSLYPSKDFPCRQIRMGGKRINRYCGLEV